VSDDMSIDRAVAGTDNRYGQLLPPVRAMQ
jgi:hypothetical protein